MREKEYIEVEAQVRSTAGNEQQIDTLNESVEETGEKEYRWNVILRMCVGAIRHPRTLLRKINARNIRKFFRLLNDGDFDELRERMMGSMSAQERLKVAPPEIIKPRTFEGKACKQEDYPVLVVPQWEKPEVSIVIPVYNQFEYTYLCVQSILSNSGDITYEIIIADDCSTDVTMEVSKILQGVVCIKNSENLRFLRNCNNAAKYAKGSYILFLNNDTQVMPNWLSPLVSLMEDDERIGLVGSKLIYPNGLLQEAGGILWKNGSAWNYGNRRNPGLPEFNYVKEVDYISGASIMIRKELWEEIGGFDETFVPAYCEDSDLAFAVHKRGYKVIYQPKSVVVHFEGVSNGTDLTAGQKKYQVENSEKFRNKWREELNNHPDKGEHVFLARDRSYRKKTILIVDHYVPQYDKDAGSRTVFQYLKLFVSLGFSVKFIGDNFFCDEPYTTELQQMGIEVLYGSKMAKNWKKWIQENGAYIDYAFLNRPHIAPRYIEPLRKYSHAPIIYYGHDLAFLRGMREYKVTGSKEFRIEAEAWKKKELELMRRVDMAYYPSTVEVEEIHKIAPNINVKAIPAYLFEDVEWTGYEVEKRRNIMFIGGFGHRPNVDAVRWLAKDVMPKLKNQFPDIVVYVLGSNPPKEVTELESENLRIVGFVTDEELTQYYSKCRMVVVPLRYGAGIKGKVIEAMRYGMPVVTTSVGAEGIIGSENILSIADDAEEFAARIAALYEDEDALIEMSKKEVEYVKDNFSPQNAIRVIGPEFGLEEEKI